MARHQRARLEEMGQPRRKPLRLASAESDGDASPSPALELRAALESRLRAGDDRWPPAATAGFILATCGSFWALVFTVVSRLLHG